GKSGNSRMPFCAASEERSYSRSRQILCKYPTGPTPARRLLRQPYKRETIAIANPRRRRIMATETVWRLRGDVMETCSCATTCPCNFGSDPIPLPCEVVIGWRIADGHYGNTRLAGLNVVLYGRIPGNAFQGNWNVGVYLDQRADQQQAQALGNIFSGQAGGWPSVLGQLIANTFSPKQVPIQFETVDDEHRITVPGLL